MAKYHVQTDNGTYEVEVDESENMAQQSSSQPETRSPDLLSTLYGGALAGGAMTLGGAAGAIVGAPAGPIGSGLAGVAGAAAMYPLAKRATEGIDRLRGIEPAPAGNPLQEFGEGVAVEAGGRALKPVLGALGKMLPGAKTGEMISGTPASNLKRAYKKGFVDTYLKPGLPGARKETGEALGEAKSKLMVDYLSPEDQAGLLINPKGEANQKVANIYTQFLKGEDISVQDAVAAKQAIQTIFPPDTARNATRIPKFAEFGKKLSEIIGIKEPGYKATSDASADAILRSQLMKPMRVNKNNPDQYSKIGGMFNTALLGGGAMTGGILPAVVAALGSSPLAMGLTSSIAGSTVRTVAGVPSEIARRAAYATFIDKITTRDNP